MDADEREFFKGLNSAKKYNKTYKDVGKSQQPHFNPMQPFVNAWPDIALNSTSSKSENIPALPIPLEYTGSAWQWEYDGFPVRPYYLAGICIQENGENVWRCFLDHATKTITSLTPLKIQKDPTGRHFVEVKKKGETKKYYIDEVLEKCFGPNHKTATPLTQTDTVVTITASPVSNGVSLSTIQVKKPNVTIFQYDNGEWAFYFEGKFCVSRKHSLAAWMAIDWEKKTYSKVTPYRIHTRSDGSKYVSVKQKDGTYKDFELDIAVCTTFNGPPSIPNAKVRHIDGNLGNCDASNLEWIEKTEQ